MTTTRAAVVYVLIDPRDGSTRYVGKTVEPEKRLAAHLYAATTDKKSHLIRWIQLLLRERVLPIFKVLVMCETEQEALRIEIGWIKVLRGAGVSLTNLTNGGDGATGFVHTKEHREKIGNILRGRSFSIEHRVALKGPKSESHKEALRAAAIKRYESPAERKAVGDRSRGRVASSETRAKLSAAAKRQVNKGSLPCVAGCQCGRHKSYERTPEIRAKIRAAQLAYLETRI